MDRIKSQSRRAPPECPPEAGGGRPQLEQPAGRGAAPEPLGEDVVPRVIATRFREAFRQPGCPLCLLGQQALDEYFSRWVWDYVSDPDLREAMRHGLGMCPEHTWQLYQTDMREYGETFGVSIIYQELLAHTLALVRRVAGQAEARRVQRPARLERLRRWLYRRSASRRWFAPARWRGSQLLRAAGCHVCAYRAESERRSIYWLVQMLQQPDNRALYSTSEGLCLPHLRGALDLAMETQPEVAGFLAATAEQHMTALAADLDAVIAKHAWDRRHEVMTEREQAAAYRASRFFGGLDGWSAARKRLDSI